MLRAWHKLTAYHWRWNRNHDNSALAICSCGWKVSTFRKGIRGHLREVPCLFLGHNWDDPESSEIGPVDFEDGEGDYKMMTHQCDRCFKVESLSDWEPVV